MIFKMIYFKKLFSDVKNNRLACYFMILLFLSMMLNIGCYFIINHAKEVCDEYRTLSNELLNTNEQLINEIIDYRNMYITEYMKNKEKAKNTKLNNNEFDLLCRLVECEAQDLSKDSKSYIVSVVMNRVNSNKFPNTITDVIYQENQFTPVSTGKIDRIKVTDDTVAVVNDTLESNVDKTNGALYFGNMSDVSQSDYNWFHTLEYIFEKEGHTFFK